MFDNGRPTPKQELIIMSVLGVFGLLTGLLAAVNSAKWGSAGQGIELSGVAPGPVAAASGYVSFVGFFTFASCGLAYPLFGRGARAPYWARSSFSWLAFAGALFVLWLTAAAALAAEQGEPSCGGASERYGVPCAVGAGALGFAWLGWILASAHLFTAALWFWKRHDIVPGDRPWRRSYITSRDNVAPAASDKRAHISRPRPHADRVSLDHVGRGEYISKLEG